MATAITSVQADNISHALFLDVQIGANVYYMSSAYKPITIGSNTYNELGTFLTIIIVALVEFLFLNQFASKYISANANLVKYNILSAIQNNL